MGWVVGSYADFQKKKYMYIMFIVSVGSSMFSQCRREHMETYVYNCMHSQKLYSSVHVLNTTHIHIYTHTNKLEATSNKSAYNNLYIYRCDSYMCLFSSVQCLMPRNGYHPHGIKKS